MNKSHRRHEPFDGYRDIIPEFDAFQEIIRRPLPVHLRVNRLKIEPGPLLKMFDEQGISVEKTAAWDNSLFAAPELQSPGNLLEYYLGYVHPQALTSCPTKSPPDMQPT